MVRSQSWVVSTSLWLGPFLDAIRYSSAETGDRMVYIVYQMLLFRNSLIFKTEIVPVHWVLQRTICLTMSATTLMLLVLPLTLQIPGTLLLPLQRPREFFLFPESPLPQDLSRLILMAALGCQGWHGIYFQGFGGQTCGSRGSTLFKPSILESKFIATWAGIIYVIQKLHAEWIFIKDNSVTVINQIQDKTKQLEAHSLLRDIWTSIRATMQ